METRNHPVSIKTITDYHLESFIRCPYKFYYHHVLSLNDSEIKWREIVQYIINQVVQKYYQLPLQDQNKLSILKLFDPYSNYINPQLFEERSHYYMTLAKITDHLLQFLTSRKNQHPPLFLYEKLKTYARELETHLSVTLELVEWSTQSFTIKKFLVEADDELIKLYNYLIVVFSDKAFGKLPEKIEIIQLFTGKIYTYSPTEEDASQGIFYLNYMKSLLQQPRDYKRTASMKECMSCPFTQQCKDDYKISKEIKNSTLNFLH
jgi:hypothetical protein